MNQKFFFPNALLLVMDTTVGIVPESMEGSLVTNTKSCIAVGTRAPSEGETEVILRHGIGEASFLQIKAFDGVIETPSQTITICTVYGEVVVENRVSSKTSRIVVWVDDVAEPTKVEVQVADVENVNEGQGVRLGIRD